MKLKEIREASGKKQRDVVKAAVSSGMDKRIDVSTYSRCENGVVLLKPKDGSIVADVIGAEVSDFYAEEDVDFGILRPQKARRKDRMSECYKLTIRLDKGLASRFEWALGVLNVTSKTECVKKYVRLIIKTAERRQKESPPVMEPQTAGAAETASTNTPQV